MGIAEEEEEDHSTVFLGLTQMSRSPPLGRNLKLNGWEREKVGLRNSSDGQSTERDRMLTAPTRCSPLGSQTVLGT